MRVSESGAWLVKIQTPVISNIRQRAEPRLTPGIPGNPGPAFIMPYIPSPEFVESVKHTAIIKLTILIMAAVLWGHFVGFSLISKIPITNHHT